MSLNLLWQEYKEQHPDSYQYSWFCHNYRDWTGRFDVIMRHEHRAEEKLFVDYAGQTVEMIDQATLSQKVEDWIQSHVRAFTFFWGVPEVIVPDNLKSGVTKACLYEPNINPTYNDLARHYETVVIPARVRKPRG